VERSTPALVLSLYSFESFSVFAKRVRIWSKASFTV
jgi:hypothetical protein